MIGRRNGGGNAVERRAHRMQHTFGIFFSFYYNIIDKKNTNKQIKRM